VFSLGFNGRHAAHSDVDFLAIAKGLRLLTLESRLAWREGRRDDSLRALNAVARSADGLLRTPIVLTWIYGAASERWVANAAAEIVADPCADVAVVEAVRASLPVEGAIERGTVTLAAAIARIADERLAYLDDVNDPSLGWSLPFWISSHYLFEDLFVAEILDRWGRYLEIGQQPMTGWERETTDTILDRPTWQRGLSLTGSMVPNLLSGWARAQAADTELAQLALAIELRVQSPAGLESDACASVAELAPTPLTGRPIVCRHDPGLGAIVLAVPDAEAALSRHMPPDSDASRFSPIVLPVGPRPASCGG
jgi:hypothetical protein